MNLTQRKPSKIRRSIAVVRTCATTPDFSGVTSTYMYELKACEREIDEYPTYGWRFSAVLASFVARSCSALSPVSAGMGDRLWVGIPPRYVGLSQLGQLSLVSLWGRSVPALIGWGKGGNVTSAGWQVILCDPGSTHCGLRNGENEVCYLGFPCLFFSFFFLSRLLARVTAASTSAV